MGKQFTFRLHDCWKIALKCLVNFHEFYKIVSLALFHLKLFFSATHLLSRPASTLGVEIGLGRKYIIGMQDCWKIDLDCRDNFFDDHTTVSLALFHF